VEFIQLRPRLEGLPEPSREERIARLKGLIARGEYAVDGARIAEAMLRDPAVTTTLGLGPAR
jgi:anti-sigma28 factor (negative regulator of flagellin synthesis)